MGLCVYLFSLQVWEYSDITVLLGCLIIAGQVLLSSQSFVLYFSPFLNFITL